MKIAIVLTDQSFLRTKSMGIFNISMGLAKGLMHHPGVKELHILCNNECGDTFKDCPSHVKLHLLNKPVPRRFGRVWWDQFGLSAYVRKISPEWLILPKGFPPYFPCIGKTKLACYVHDVCWEYYETKPAEVRNKAFPRHELLYFKTLSLHALKISDLILTHSRFNESRILAHAPNATIARIGIGFEAPLSIPEQTAEKKDILTYASTFHHKRMDLVLKHITAWIAQRPDREQIKVHLVGSLPDSFKLPQENWVHHPRLPFAELCRLMRQRCRMTVYISDYESFGMPPVESFLNGIPCIASDFPSFHENIPESYIFPKEDTEAFIAKANEVYDGKIPFECPTYPTWAEVTDRCVRALTEHS